MYINSSNLNTTGYFYCVQKCIYLYYYEKQRSGTRFVAILFCIPPKIVIRSKCHRIQFTLEFSSRRYVHKYVLYIYAQYVMCSNTNRAYRNELPGFHNMENMPHRIKYIYDYVHNVLRIYTQRSHRQSSVCI